MADQQEPDDPTEVAPSEIQHEIPSSLPTQERRLPSGHTEAELVGGAGAKAPRIWHSRP